jgi:tetratricopeptide (TPR) repeat protein
MAAAAASLQQLHRLCQDGDYARALPLCEALLQSQPELPDLQLLASQLYQQAGRFDRMWETATAASALAPGHAGAWQRRVEALVYGGRIGEARALLDGFEQRCQEDPLLLQRVAELRVHCTDFAGARRCHERAVTLAPRHAGLWVNLATSCIALGNIERAEAHLRQALALDPADFGAHLHVAQLRRWSEEDNHVGVLQQRLAALPEDHPGRVPLHYALAKELEDLGDDDASLDHVEAGATLRRSRLAYDVQTDVRALQRITEVFDAPTLARRAAASAQGPQPWFVLGLPRSGTTLVERILGSHSTLASLGEVENFAFSLLQLGGNVGGKLALIERSAQLDFAQLGRLYRSAIASYGLPAPGLINKTPLNYLYLGLIHLALPDARVVHLRRQPLDSAYAMWKTLFRMGYPFSYSLEDLGHYLLAYQRLMAHWREHIGASFVEIDYETLVHDQAGQTAQLLGAVGLPWEDACLHFQHNPAPSATASATQVREPLHSRSAGRWRVHAKRLAPLADFLQSHGVDCG